jgi:hypothetical protein
MLDNLGSISGFNVRRHGGKLLINPARPRSGGCARKLAVEMHALRGSNAQAVLATIVPITRGWAACYRCVVSKRVFTALDDYMWKLTYKWACYSHSNKPKSWIVNRYYGRFNTARNDYWVFGDRDSGGYPPEAEEYVRRSEADRRAFELTRVLGRVWWRSSQIFGSASPRPSSTAGSVRSKGSRSA